MCHPSFRKPKGVALKTFMNEMNEFVESSNQCPNFVELSLFSKSLKILWKLTKYFLSKKKLKKENDLKLNKRKKEKSSFKNTKIECFNYGRVRHDYWLS